MRESGRSTASCLESHDLLAKHPGLLPASAFALNIYTLDTRQIVSLTPKHVNLFCEYALLLRKRDPVINRQLAGYSYYFFHGLNKLPDWAGELYRGIDAAGVALIKQHYKLSKSIHWTAMSSATPSPAVARAFAGADGIVLRITVKTGKDIRQFSAIPAEDEVLLRPNFRMVVMSEPKMDAAIGVEVIDLHEREEGTFTF